MSYPSSDGLLDKVDSKYTLVVAIAKRARQLVDGEEPKIETRQKKPVSIAIEEVKAGKISYRKTKEGIK